MGWIGVDLDGTLAQWDGSHFPAIGPPIAPMVERVKGWLAELKDVRIFTARAHVGTDAAWIESAASFGHTPETWLAAQVELIEAWCVEHLGQVLPITATKDFGMLELWDDRCVQVVSNIGIPMLDWHDALLARTRDLTERPEPL